MKYIISVKHPTRASDKNPKNKQTYICMLNPDFTISCTSDIKKAYLFDNFEVAWLVAKAKKETYHNECEVTVLNKEYFKNV